ncbi:selenocysteine-specific translation elongation factor [Thermomonas brevis]
MIVGTAGHIDHGKTSLVRALTGIDTDRLQEEKARGISIELGYAYVPLADGGTLGFVDVPGHERFVHTMVAGATGIDIALLVIAADDGPMPQTREHLAILELLGVSRGAVALTKADRVDADALAAVRAQVAALLAPTPLREVPLFACNATDADDAGVAALRAHLHALAADARQDAHDDALLRLPVDRMFSLPGHGTVVAGPVQGGRVAVGDSLRLMPGGQAVRVRGLHAQNRPATSAGRGQRAALNLAGIAREAIARGDWIADARAFAPSRQVDARLRLLPGAPSLRDGLKLHVHWGAGHRLARVLRLDDADGADGALVQLVFDAPVCAATGDRFIVRDEAASATVGGGVLLDPEAPQRRRRRPQRLAWLAALEGMLRGAGIAPLLAQAPQGIALDVLARRLQRPAERILLPADAVQAAGHVVARDHWQALAARVEDVLRDWHARHPDDPGLEAGRLRRLAFPALAPALLTALLQALQAEGRLQQQGAWWQLPGHAQRGSERDAALLAKLLPLLDAGGFDPPWVRTLAADTRSDEAQVRAILRRAAARGEVHQVVPDLFYHPRRIAELAAVIARLAEAGDGAVEAAAYRDAIGIGRKRAIQVLEFFDRAGYTRRVGAGHRPRGESQWGDASRP